MKKEDLYNGISGINSKYLDEADNYGKTEIKKGGRLKRIVAVAACICLMTVGVFATFSNKHFGTPFAISVYAMDENGELQTIKMEENDVVQLAEINLPRQVKGFVFTVNTEDSESESKIFILSNNESTALPKITEDIKKQQWYEENGLNYFFYIPNIESDEVNFSEAISVINTEQDGSAIKFNLLFTASSGEYSATLNGITLYPSEKSVDSNELQSAESNESSVYADKPGAYGVIRSADDIYADKCEDDAKESENTLEYAEK